MSFIIAWLAQMEPWTTSRVVGSPEPPLPYRVERVFPDLKLKNPLYMAFEPGRGRALIVEAAGRIIAPPGDLFHEIKDWNFYSILFDPDYARNGRVYLFTNGPNSAKRKKNRILRLEARTEKIIIEWESNGHDGGEMAFGPDGYLYISSGDGTSDSDGNDTGQDVRDLASGILRIDVEHPDPGRAYSVPKDNPFLAVEGARPELWAYGFRNPWRMCFDPKTGDLWVGDIGQDLWEMIHVVQRGANYGWSLFEGGRPFHPKRRPGPTPISPPTIAHHHSEARSITGGLVYTGARFKELQGAYLYGDYSTGRIWAARYENGKVAWNREIADTTLAILGFAQDAAGEIYVVDYNGHSIHRLEPGAAAVAPASEFPRKLSDSGVFLSVEGHRTHPALIPYTVNAPLWSDGAHKERFIGLPGVTRIEFSEKDAWKFPEGTVLVKTFSLDGTRRIETRFLTLQQNEWVGYSYAWNEAGTEATLVDKAGLDRDFGKQTWRYPSRAECMVCHSRAAGFVLGVNTLQVKDLGALERLGVFRGSVLDHVKAGERRRLADLRSDVEPGRTLLPLHVVSSIADAADPLRIVSKIFRSRVMAGLERAPRATSRLVKRLEDYRRLSDPHDASAGLEARARSYLHANCAQCHMDAGGGNSAIDLRFTLDRRDMKLFGARPLHDAFGIRDAALVASGEPDRSVLLQRMSKLGNGRMPPLASSIADDPAAELLREWIRGLKPVVAQGDGFEVDGDFPGGSIEIERIDGDTVHVRPMAPEWALRARGTADRVLTFVFPAGSLLSPSVSTDGRKSWSRLAMSGDSFRLPLPPDRKDVYVGSR